MLTVMLIVLAVALLYIFSTACRKGHPALNALQGWSYAHRGLHSEDCPENSMAAFRKALESGYGIELDIHLLRDGNLAVIHDSSLKRTAGADIRIEDLCTEDLKHYKLGHTEETIPEFQQVLDLFSGKAPLIVELKSAGNNYAALTEAACNLLSSYTGPYCLESFDPRCIGWLRKHRPELIRGQLAENFLRSKGPLPLVLKGIMTFQIANFLTLPDFVAYKFSDRKNLGNLLARKLWKAQGVSWTLKTQEEYETAVKEGWLPIFENFQP